MKIKHLLIICTVAMISANCSDKGEITRINNGVQLKRKDVNVRVQFYSDNTVKITKWPANSKVDRVSLSVVMTPDSSVKVAYQENETEILMSTSKLKLKLSRNTGEVKFFNLSDTSLLAEKGLDFKPVVFDGDSGYAIKQNFVLTKDEGIYGLGEHQDGYMNYRGKKVSLSQANTGAVTPFLISTNGYGILWDNYSYTVFNDSTDGASMQSDMGDNIDYYFIQGNNMDEVIAGYRTLTGAAPMYGKYAYGYWQSKEHYDTGKELVAAAKGYRSRKIPIDNIVQDWDYWNGAPNWGSLRFDSTLFPKPKEMIDQLHQLNFHLMISIWPAMGPKTEIYKELDNKNLLYKPIGWAGFKYYDTYNPEANQVYWKYMKEGLYDKGVDAWWMDSTEPDVINANTKESSNYEIKKMGSNYLGSFARYLNPYSLVMTEAVSKELRKVSDKRVYILTRSTFAGQQRTGATTWSGDIGASWLIYRNQISAGINHCMSGIPYWTFDIGAFVLGSYGGVFCYGGKNPAYQEFYTRMFQFGAFSPIFRSHGSETPREIWEMGEFQNVLIKYDNLRYRLLPYIYSQAWKVTSEGYTIMRGLPMDFAADKKTYGIDDQFMFGPSIMASPVTENMYYRSPEASVKVEDVFKTNDGKPGLLTRYYKDTEYKKFTKEQVEKDIDIVYYTGRPDYVTDSMFAVRWEGKLIPKETGKYQFHMKSYDAKRLKIDGKTLPISYASVEQYTEIIELTAGKEYSFLLETENKSTGAAKMQLFWRTPAQFEKEKSPITTEKSRQVYLPANTNWIDFWTGKTYKGGQEIKSNAPIDIIPLFVRAGSIIPMGPLVQYATEKPADVIELRIYPGVNGNFVLYEDENENHNYEKGVYATIGFSWDDASKKLTIAARKGEFPGMLKNRTFNVVLVNEGIGIGGDMEKKINTTIMYTGQKTEAQL